MPGRLLSFPAVVDERVARVVAGGVMLLGLLAIRLELAWLAVALAVGFALRVAAGPRLSPLALLASRVIVPRLRSRPRLVAGPPKRFAQAIGFVVSAVAAALFLAGSVTAAEIVLALLVAAATLEAFAGLCLGCAAFALLMRAGLIPASVCERCNDLRLGAEPQSPAPARRS